MKKFLDYWLGHIYIKGKRSIKKENAIETYFLIQYYKECIFCGKVIEL